MMKGRILIGGDFGTNGLKLLAFDSGTGKAVATSYRSYPVRVPAANHAEHDPDDWWKAFKAGIGELLSSGIEPKQIAAIGMSCHVPTLLPVDENGTVLHNGVIWADYRSSPQCENIRNLYGEELYKINPLELRSHQMVNKILWLKEECQGLYDRTACFLQCSGYIVYLLTGKWSIDHGNAAIFHLYNVHTGQWDKRGCELVGVDVEKLPPIYGSDQVVGNILPDMAKETGLDPQTLIVAGTGDTPAAALGVGCIEEGDICFSAGTAASMVTVFDCGKRPFRTDPRLLTIGHTLPGKMLNVAVMSCVGGALKWARDALGSEEEKLAAAYGEDVFDLICSEASKSEPGAGGLLFFPYLFGDLSPYFNPDARGVFIGINETTRKKEIFRAILEGTCYAFRQNLNILDELGVFSNRGEIIATGGPASSPLWMQLLADISGLEVSVLDNTLGAPFGDVILAGVGAGIYPDQISAARRNIKRSRTYLPDRGGQSVYDPCFRAYDSIAERLQADFAILKKELGK